jgi:hypothetical protein
MEVSHHAKFSKNRCNNVGMYKDQTNTPIDALLYIQPSRVSDTAPWKNQLYINTRATFCFGCRSVYSAQLLRISCFGIYPEDMSLYSWVPNVFCLDHRSVCPDPLLGYLLQLVKKISKVFLSNDTEQNPFWEAKITSACEEIPCLLCKPKSYYRVHKSPPLVPIPGSDGPSTDSHTYKYSWRPSLILSSRMLSSSVKMLYVYLTSSMHAKCPVPHFLWILKYFMKKANCGILHHAAFFIILLLAPLNWKYPLEHPVLRNPEHLYSHILNHKFNP